LAARFNKPYA